jgi:hypothetical protein
MEGSMNARGALVGFLLAGFAVLALSSLTPGAKEDASARVACSADGDCAYASVDFPKSNTRTLNTGRERGGERFNF